MTVYIEHWNEPSGCYDVTRWELHVRIGGPS